MDKIRTVHGDPSERLVRPSVVQRNFWKDWGRNSGTLAPLWQHSGLRRRRLLLHPRARATLPSATHHLRNRPNGLACLEDAELWPSIAYHANTPELLALSTTYVHQLYPPHGAGRNACCFSGIKSRIPPTEWCRSPHARYWYSTSAVLHGDPAANPQDGAPCPAVLSAASRSTSTTRRLQFSPENPASASATAKRGVKRLLSDDRDLRNHESNIQVA